MLTRRVTSLNNIEPLARAICERDLRRFCKSEAELAADVDRYWHCVAADIESGFIDDAGQRIDHDIDVGLAAYRDWRAAIPIAGYRADVPSDADAP